jgi:hypothetical protein
MRSSTSLLRWKMRGSGAKGGQVGVGFRGDRESSRRPSKRDDRDSRKSKTRSQSEMVRDSKVSSRRRKAICQAQRSQSQRWDWVGGGGARFPR